MKQARRLMNIMDRMCSGASTAATNLLLRPIGIASNSAASIAITLANN